MKIARLLIAVLFFGAFVDACVGATTESGSNSNWLDTCVANTDCSGGLTCVCGACTKLCSTEADCSGVGSSATCATPASAASTCKATRACVKSSDRGGSSAVDSGSSEGDSSTTTRGSWAAVCGSDADCDSGLQCFCGLCTAPCKTTAECTKFSAGATCPDSYEINSACAANPPPTGSSGCAIECTTDENCGSLGPDAVCTGGFCKKPVLVSHADGGVVTCEDRGAEMSPKIAAVFASADRACKTNSDCTTVALGTKCYGDGCTDVAVANTAAASITAQLKTIEAQYCGDFFKAGCVGPGFGSCVAEAVQACVDGTCEIPPISLTGTTPTQTCADRDQQIALDLSSYETSAGLACAKDSDCVIQDLVSCGGGCGTLISKSGLVDIAEDLTAIEQSLCVPYADAGCHPLALPCLAPTVPKCVANACTR